MDLLTPSIGNIFWTAVTFLLLLALLAKFAWKPILSAVGERQATIQDALNQATLARKEMEHLKADNEKIMREGRMERDAMLKEARDMRDKMIADARESAKAEGDKMVEAARQSIAGEKAAAMADIRNQIGMLSVGIAENILRQKLDNSAAQEQLVNTYLNNNLN